MSETAVSGKTTAESKENITYNVGDYVELQGTKKKTRKGYIRFKGKIEAFGECVGIELDEKINDGTNGRFNDEQYFECDEGKGSFVKMAKIIKRLEAPKSTETNKQTSSEDNESFPANAALISKSEAEQLAPKKKKKKKKKKKTATTNGTKKSKKSTTGKKEKEKGGGLHKNLKPSNARRANSKRLSASSKKKSSSGGAKKKKEIDFNIPSSGTNKDKFKFIFSRINNVKSPFKKRIEIMSKTIDILEDEKCDELGAKYAVDQYKKCFTSQLTDRKKTVHLSALKLLDVMVRRHPKQLKPQTAFYLKHLMEYMEKADKKTMAAAESLIKLMCLTLTVKDNKCLGIIMAELIRFGTSAKNKVSRKNGWKFIGLILKRYEPKKGAKKTKKKKASKSFKTVLDAIQTGLKQGLADSDKATQKEAMSVLIILSLIDEARADRLTARMSAGQRRNLDKLTGKRGPQKSQTNIKPAAKSKKNIKLPKKSGAKKGTKSPKPPKSPHSKEKGTKKGDKKGSKTKEKVEKKRKEKENKEKEKEKKETTAEKEKSVKEEETAPAAKAPVTETETAAAAKKAEEDDDDKKEKEKEKEVVTKMAEKKENAEEAAAAGEEEEGDDEDEDDDDEEEEEDEYEDDDDDEDSDSSDEDGDDSLISSGDSNENDARDLIESFLDLKDPQINWKMIEFLSKDNMTHLLMSYISRMPQGPKIWQMELSVDLETIIANTKSLSSEAADEIRATQLSYSLMRILSNEHCAETVKSFLLRKCQEICLHALAVFHPSSSGNVYHGRVVLEILLNHWPKSFMAALTNQRHIQSLLKCALFRNLHQGNLNSFFLDLICFATNTPAAAAQSATNSTSAQQIQPVKSKLISMFVEWQFVEYLLRVSTTDKYGDDSVATKYATFFIDMVARCASIREAEALFLGRENLIIDSFMGGLLNNKLTTWHRISCGQTLVQFLDISSRPTIMDPASAMAGMLGVVAPDPMSNILHPMFDGALQRLHTFIAKMCHVITSPSSPPAAQIKLASSTIAHPFGQIKLNCLELLTVSADFAQFKCGDVLNLLPTQFWAQLLNMAFIHNENNMFLCHFRRLIHLSMIFRRRFLKFLFVEEKLLERFVDYYQNRAHPRTTLHGYILQMLWDIYNHDQQQQEDESNEDAKRDSVIINDGEPDAQETVEEEDDVVLKPNFSREPQDQWDIVAYFNHNEIWKQFIVTVSIQMEAQNATETQVPNMNVQNNQQQLDQLLQNLLGPNNDETSDSTDSDSDSDED